MSQQPAGGSDVTYRCSACGNKTRFDVTEAKRVRSFLHFTLGGELTVEEEEVLERTVEKVACRWCGSETAVEGMEAGSQPHRRSGGEPAGRSGAPRAR
jgi:hypothetical protein